MKCLRTTCCSLHRLGGSDFNYERDVRGPPMQRFLDFWLPRVTGGGFWPLLLRAAAGYGSLRILGMLASFAAGVQLARGLGVQGFGYYSIVLAIITLAGLPSEVGLPFLVMREVAAASGRRDYAELFGIIGWAKRTALRTSLSVAAIALCAAAVIYRFYSHTVAESLLLGLPVIPLTAQSRVRGGAIQGLNRVALGQTPETIFRPALYSVLLGIAYISNIRISPPLAMGLYSLTSVVMLTASSLFLRNSLPDRPQSHALSTRRSIMASIPMGLMDAMRIVQGEISIALAGIAAPAAVVGLLRVANVTSITAALPLVVMTQIGMPLMATLHATNERARLQKTVTLVAQAQFAGTLLVGLPLLLIPAHLLGFAFGSSFGAAAGALRILTIAQIMNAGFGPNIWLLNMTGHERKVLRSLAIALVLNVLAVPLAAKYNGATGAAAALFVASLTWNFISWRDARQLLEVETSIFHWPWQIKAGRE